MPELPEVETTRLGILPHLDKRKVKQVIIRNKNLRWPVSSEISTLLPGHSFKSVTRRGKYLLLETSVGTLMIHLGMSGSLRIIDRSAAIGKHDHVDILLDNNKALRYTDPRRFGSLLWQSGDIDLHPLLASLGPEPLEDEFDGNYLFKLSRQRKLAIKLFIMNSKIVVGVGNIYANEALYRAGINPARLAGRISKQRYGELALQIQSVLREAIKVGGTTLRDFTGSDGEPGYFKQSLSVYGRGDLPCLQCGQNLKETRLGNRSTVYCVSCQT